MKSSQPLISVVMPLYNHEQYVEATVNSVLGQSYTNLELIIIDDCSTDGSLGKVSTIRDDRIRVAIHPQNLGAYASINKGILLARGEYISVINSDDIYADRRLETLYRHCTNDDVSLAGTSMVLIDERGKKIESAGHWWRQWYDDLVRCYVETQDLYLAALRGNFFITTSNFFFPRSLVDHVGYFHPYRYVHDYEFLFRALVTPGIRVAFYHDEPLLYYRLHTTNTIRGNAKEANRETFDILVAYGSRLAAVDVPRGHAAVLSHLQKIRHHIEDAYVDEKVRCPDAHPENNRVNREIEFLRSEISKITATKGYRLEKAMYEFYLRIRNLGRSEGGS